MKKFKGNRFFAGLVSAALICSCAPIASAAGFDLDFNNPAVVSADSDVIFESDFENGAGVSEFSGRDGFGTIESCSNDAHSGSGSMKVTDRTKGWHGPQIAIDGKCETGTEYVVSAWIKAEWYNDVKISYEYTDASGERSFHNIVNKVSQGDWVEFPETKFSFPEDATKMYVYVEANDGTNLYIDDFKIAKAPILDIEQDIKSLKNVYSPHFKFGTAVTASEIISQSRQNLINKHFNSITPGNELKPESILYRNACIAAVNDNPHVNISGARPILNFCRDNNIPVRGHVLVWHSQTPDWFFKENYSDDGDWVSKETMLKRMENYIKNVFDVLEKEYPTVNFYAWDVVNEAWLDNGNPRKAGGYNIDSETSGWVSVFGDNSFIEPAFEYARKYAPEGCKLYYNDFNEYMPDKTKAIVNMANSLKEKNLIDGIGMQSHLDVRSGSDAFPSVSAYKKALAAFAETGLDIQVTELDATVNDSKFEEQAQYYSDIMDAIMEYKDNVSAVVLWGTTDDASWRANKTPLVFDGSFKAKPAFYSIVDGLEEVTPTDPTEPTKPAEYSASVGVYDADTGELVPGAKVSIIRSSKSISGAVLAPGDVKIAEWDTADENPKNLDGLKSKVDDDVYFVYYADFVSIPEGYEEPVSLDEPVKFDFLDEKNAEISLQLKKTSSPDIVYGDADLNGELEISDAAKIMSYVTNPDKYPFTEEQLNVSDVYQRGDGVSNMDALSVRKRLAQIISELPESYNK